MHDPCPVLVVEIDEILFPLLVESLSNADEIAGMFYAAEYAYYGR